MGNYSHVSGVMPMSRRPLCMAFMYGMPILKWDTQKYPVQYNLHNYPTSCLPLRSSAGIVALDHTV